MTELDDFNMKPWMYAATITDLNTFEEQLTKIITYIMKFLKMTQMDTKFFENEIRKNEVMKKLQIIQQNLCKKFVATKNKDILDYFSLNNLKRFRIEKLQ